MFKKFFKRNKLQNKNLFVEADEIFLDSKNIENFDIQQFEGRIEKPISKNNILFLGFLFLGLLVFFGTRLAYLQIEQGENYFTRSENNTLDKEIIFADRGIIYDRNKKELAWNTKNEESYNFSFRNYMKPGFSHTLGYVSYPTKDKSGNFWQTEFIGKDGLEKQYNEQIKGKNGIKIIEIDAKKNIHSENIINPPTTGKELVTTIDSRIQSQLFYLIKNLADQHSFKGGSGIIIDIHTGEIIASTNFPEYDSEILSYGKDKLKINEYINDKRKVFLNKSISGLYTPGSIVKPFFAYGALVENIISPNKQILSTGSLVVPNPYFPDKPTIFKDWKAHGWVDMRKAIAVSSDVYFYQIGGGFEEQKGLGITNIDKYAKLFGIGQKTGVDISGEVEGLIPTPEWKLKNFNGDPWRVGNTYHTAIGQFGFQVTPIQMVRANAAIANNGKLVTPHFILGDKKMENNFTTIDLPENLLNIVKEGMRDAVLYGTAVSLNVPYVSVASKTGTAQLGLLKDRVNSWIMGFFPYDNPKYSFVVMMESGPSSGGVGASSIMRGLLDWMNLNTPEYFE